MYERLNSSIEVYFITGFLGAGKTTLINNILNDINEEKIGLIINEFGDINVDSTIIENDEDTTIKEINNGSIFCSCRSGSLIKNILSYQDFSVDYLIIESSGLSQPSSLDSIINEVNKQAKENFNFKGMIGIVDASNFLTLIQSTAAVKEQVIYSDLILINKTDKVDKTQINKIYEKIRNFNKEADILQTEYCDIGKEIIKDGYFEDRIKEKEVQDLTGFNNPDLLLLDIKTNIDREKLNNFLEEISEISYRIKGFADTNKGNLRIEGTEKEIHFFELEELEKSEGLIVFTKDKDKLIEKVNKTEKEISLKE